MPVCPSPAVTLRIGAPGVAVDTNATEPRLGTPAATRFVPTTVPIVQLETCASPLASVVAGTPLTLPPPMLTENDTATPATPRPLASTTRMAGAIAAAVATSAECVELPTTITLVAAPIALATVNAFDV